MADVKNVSISKGVYEIGILLVAAGLAPTLNAAARKCKEGAVSIGEHDACDTPVRHHRVAVTLWKPMTLRLGKRYVYLDTDVVRVV